MAKHNSYKKVLGQEANSPTVAQISHVSSKGDIREISDVISYCLSPQEFCFTQGDPHVISDLCCPAEKPFCLPQEDPKRCCPSGYKKLCGLYCCVADSFCCNEKICCEKESACCGARCCEDGEYCCYRFSCCDSADACCRGLCCREDASCCKHDESEACCNKVTMGCCDGYGCVPPCPSQFDAIGCQLSSLSLDDKLLEVPYGLPTNVYRLLRPNENPDGIVAKNPGAQKSVLSHVNCGSRPKYASQFISTSASLDVAKDYKKKGEEKGLTGLRICEFEVDKLPQTCQIVDLTTEENRDKYLGNAVCKAYAKASAEVLLQCGVPIPCTVIDTPTERQ